MPFPPGGPTDVAARLLAEKLKDRVGQNVIVESRAGAGGATGTGYVAQQPGNGCTLLLAYDTHAVNPVLLTLPFDTLDRVQAGGDDRHHPQHHRARIRRSPTRPSPRW